MSGVDYYVGLLDNPTRIQAFQAALDTVVRPGDRVLDLGTGLGTFAFFAAQAGAEHVWAVERHRVVRVARRLAVANGLADRVTFLEGDFAGVEVPERIDLVVFEDFPSTLVDRRVHGLLDGIARRFGGAGLRTVPGQARLSVAPVADGPWMASARPPVPPAETFGLDWSPLAALGANCPHRVQLPAGALLAPPEHGPWFPLVPPPPVGALRVEGAWDAPVDGEVNALALWFDLELAPGIRLSNEPRKDAEPWGQTLLPLEQPLRVAAPERVTASVWRETVADGGPGWLAWTVEAGGQRRRGHEIAGIPLGPEDLGGEGSTNGLLGGSPNRAPDPPAKEDPT